MVLSTSADRDQYEHSTSPLSPLALPFWRLGEGHRRAAKVGPQFQIQPVAAVRLEPFLMFMFEAVEALSAGPEQTSAHLSG